MKGRILTKVSHHADGQPTSPSTQIAVFICCTSQLTFIRVLDDLHNLLTYYQAIASFDLSPSVQSLVLTYFTFLKGSTFFLVARRNFTFIYY